MAQGEVVDRVVSRCLFDALCDSSLLDLQAEHREFLWDWMESLQPDSTEEVAAWKESELAKLADELD